jgi:hypothetical protein
MQVYDYCNPCEVLLYRGELKLRYIEYLNLGKICDMLKDCPKFDEVPNKYFLPASKNSHNFRYLISKLPHPIKKPSYLSIGNSAFGLRQSAFPQPFPNLSPKNGLCLVFSLPNQIIYIPHIKISMRQSSFYTTAYWLLSNLYLQRIPTFPITCRN